jgi:uncharacterized protein
MRLENSFEVAASPEQAWRLLNDVPAVLPCMPGAELVEIVGDNAWKAALAVKLGPIGLRFLADVTRDEPDETQRRVVLAVEARETKGRGSSRATIESIAVATETGTRVDIATELELRGAVAQHGRGIIADIASRLTAEFARCIASRLEDSQVERAPAQPSARPLAGLRLLLAALWRSLLGRR